MRESVRLSRDIFSQAAFDEFRAGELEPGESVVTDAQVDAYVAENAASAYHPSCTCKMGDVDSDEMAVVDASNMTVAGKQNNIIIEQLKD